MRRKGEERPEARRVRESRGRRRGEEEDEDQEGDEKKGEKFEERVRRKLIYQCR